MKTADVVHAGLILACGVVMAAAGQILLRSPRALDIEGAVGASLSVLGIGIVVLWMLALVLALVAELLLRRGSSSAATIALRCTPALMRRLAAALLGLNLLALPALAQAAPGAPGGPAGSVAVPAAADPPATRIGGLAVAGISADGASHGEDAASSGSPYWSPTTVSGDPGPRASSPGEPGLDGPGREEPGPGPSGAPACPVAPAPSGWEPAPMPTGGGLLARAGTRTTTGSAEVVVVPGDSLWSIVASSLGPLATAAEVADAWPAWYDANRTVIGEDPSLVVPGQVLTAPP
ncbi:hypothetical protein V6S67_12050 [Arthrobacter sp. Soc17.1.1.1]|uniref:LysM peptidoglycan-binding domain-containing protein n=1 Tax=Arthrobacter sp. Soc17.1.1.1 TaxID=3121277 RepID=UPI002FE4F91C